MTTASSAKVQVSLRLPAELNASYGRIAEALDRDRSWVMLRALRHYLEAEGGDLLREAEGLAALERGEGLDFDRALAELEESVSRAEVDAPARRTG